MDSAENARHGAPEDCAGDGHVSAFGMTFFRPGSVLNRVPIGFGLHLVLVGVVLTGAPVEVSGPQLRLHREKTQGAALLLDVWAPWCGPCKAMGPQFAAAAKMLEPGVRLLKLNSDDEPAAANELGVTSIPALFLIRDGRIVARTSGSLSASQIVSWARQAIS